ncbi:hypothetical protein AWH51_12190 [Clavibacter tessellarius]|uniref:Uncharacterized protein n=1 Tax=Clavibacter tessellarius TaxID=31965 RepID=A0A154V004_9MICO|nr:hypothetical protein AWH51_12190 [Clavibacter michiganensis subsp. tessellarius]
MMCGRAACEQGGSVDRREDRIGAAHRGENPTAPAELAGGFAVIGDVHLLADADLRGTLGLMETRTM